jgi:hypothetical protein
MRHRLGSATHTQRRAAVGSARRAGAGQRRTWLRRQEVEDPQAGPKGRDWAGWDAGLKGFFGQK